MLAACHGAAAADLASALARLERGDYPAAIAELDELTSQGDPVAATRLAALYQEGLGVPKDATRAAMLYEQAAARGNADAQYNLGNMYLLGEGVPQDDDWAFTYYREAAKQGHAMAQKNVAEFYRAAGLTPPPEEVTATPAPAAPAPAVAAQPASPIDEESDRQAAAMAAATSAAAAAPPAEYSHDELNAMQLARKHGIRIADSGSLPTAPPPVRVPRGGTAPIPPVSDGDAPQASNAALPAAKALLADGKPAEARPLLEDAAHEGSAEAQYLLAQLLVTLSSGAQDNATALGWLQRAAAGGYADAQYLLGARYERGEGVLPDEAEAVTWYRAAARQGHPDAAERLRAIYREAGLPLPEELPPAGKRQGAVAPARRAPADAYACTNDGTPGCIQHACSLQAG